MISSKGCCAVLVRPGALCIFLSLLLCGFCYKSQLGYGQAIYANRVLRAAYPNKSFFSNLGAYYCLLLDIQTKVDLAAISRKIVAGTIIWYPSQIYYYARLVSRVEIRTVCELGYGAGNSALLYLMMNPDITLYSFDFFLKPGEIAPNTETTPRQGLYQKVTLDYIQSSKDFARRFKRVSGHSNVTIPRFAKEHSNVKCDLISIDGSHLSPQVYFDILHFRTLATQLTYILLDDVNDKPVRQDIDSAIAQGILKEYECLVPEQRHDENFRVLEFARKVFCAAHYKV